MLGPSSTRARCVPFECYVPRMAFKLNMPPSMHTSTRVDAYQNRLVHTTCAFFFSLNPTITSWLPPW